MNRVKVFFLSLCITLGVLFALCGFSLVQCFVFSSGAQDEAGSRFMEIAYLFLHLIMVAIILYLAIRAFIKGPSIIHLMSLDVNQVRLTKSTIISSIVAALFLFMGIYSTLFISGLKLPVLDLFSLGLAHDLMNAGFLFGSVALTCFIFPFVHKKEIKTQAE